MLQTPGMVPQVPDSGGTVGSGVHDHASPSGQRLAFSGHEMQESVDCDGDGSRHLAGVTRNGPPPEVPDPLQNLHTLVYLSCGYPALERDTQVLLQSGAWRVDSVKAFWFFPFTNSIETLVVFRRVFPQLEVVS